MRERTLPNLVIGLVVSLLMHAYIVIWGLPISIPTPEMQSPTEVEVQLRELAVPPSTLAPMEALRIEEPPVAAPAPAPAAKPVLPPNTQALENAMQTVPTSLRTDRPEVQLPERSPPLPTVDAQTDLMPLAEALTAALQYDPQLIRSATLPDLPAPERQLAEVRDLPPLPTLDRPVRQEVPAVRPTTMTLPAPHASSAIQGPAAERQVLFQPPPPIVTVESESDIELRFWILPNGTVGRVVPVKRSDPRLEALAINYLRHWRFSPLPADSLQDEQWGIIPFKFRIR